MMFVLMCSYYFGGVGLGGVDLDPYEGMPGMWLLTKKIQKGKYNKYISDISGW